MKQRDFLKLFDPANDDVEIAFDISIESHRSKSWASDADLSDVELQDPYTYLNEDEEDVDAGRRVVIYVNGDETCEQ